MQTNNGFIKNTSFIPVKVYQSVSSLYMTCISKLPRDSIQPDCDQGLVIEQALVSSVDSTLRPLDYKKRQREARKILLKSQENLLKQMHPSQILTDEDNNLTDDDEDEKFREPVRLKSTILLNEYRKLYETPRKTELDYIASIKAIEQNLWLILRLVIMACSVCALIYHGYFLSKIGKMYL
uniref:Uncharacterized protein, isoform A n=1 Tax=Drosophila melanogaster TaxID=7227 RepID=A1ZBB6_DROME|nr:uncharacterized protein Dmel_CG33136, isoform C [Drosophila melanogaster]NP_788404.1 uncharacterized protein Dmel_CG33136, isoform A [Drosophila melanogaster]AAO41348.1 uncharacterized protein Dmel_CG33136, isoform A [Drosophila melanogaster]AHN56379.1 uncharacterized protein Dmel_CG33136, isoform C [Drosophila melanogaster]|eukprot:NP_001286584.1 uncharacterized protein Dmel_CG33136, isoform C [Drosophila melanogaster]